MNYELCQHIGDIIKEEFPRLCRRPLMAFHRPEVIMAAEVEEIKKPDVPESKETEPELQVEPESERYSDMELAMMRLRSKEREEAEEREQRELDLRLMRAEDELSRKAYRPKKQYKKIERHKSAFRTVLKADSNGNVTAFDIPIDVASGDLEVLGTPSTAKPLPRVSIDKSHQEYRMQDWGKRPDTTTMGKAEEQLAAMSFGPKTYSKGTTRDGALTLQESDSNFQYMPDKSIVAGRERRAIEDKEHNVFELRADISYSLHEEGDAMSGWNIDSKSTDNTGNLLTAYFGIQDSAKNGDNDVPF